MVKDREAILCRGNLFKSYLLFALPIIATNLLQLLFNLADIAVVGIFASDADVAAVGSNTTLIGLIISLFIGLSIGTNVHLAHLIGERKGERIRYAVGTSVIISVLAGTILAVIGTIFATSFLKLMNCAESVLVLASKYLRIYFTGMPIVMLYNFSSAFLRAMGDSLRPVIFIVVGGILNVILNIVFVAGFGLTVEGVAIATVVSQGVSATLLISVLIKSKGEVRLEKNVCVLSGAN